MGNLLAITGRMNFGKWLASRNN